MNIPFKLILTLALLLTSSIGFAQTELVFNIQHKLNAYDFEINEPGMTNDSVVFTVSRLQYYVSEISVEHDGGQITAFPDTWILVSADEETTVNLGLQSINNVEKIRFSIGVDSAHNHLDPSSYQPSHPLANQFPPMHWGWVTGYFFAVVEGRDIQKNVFQIYAMGDQNYFVTELDVSSQIINGKNEVTIYGDYSKGFEDIEIRNGNITHDETGDAKTFLINFSEYVFSAVEPTDSFRLETDEPNGVKDLEPTNNISIFPNPSLEGQFMFSFTSNSDENLSAVLMDMSGKRVREKSGIQAQRTYSFRNLDSGFYVLVISDSRGVQKLLEKVIVQ